MCGCLPGDICNSSDKNTPYGSMVSLCLVIGAQAIYLNVTDGFLFTERCPLRVCPSMR